MILTPSSCSAPLSNFCDDPDVNKDALFLHHLSNLYDYPDVNKDALFLDPLGN